MGTRITTKMGKNGGGGADLWWDEPMEDMEEPSSVVDLEPSISKPNVCVCVCVLCVRVCVCACVCACVHMCVLVGVGM